MIPLYGFAAGDTLGVLVLVDSNDTVAELSRVLAQAVSVRVELSGGLCIEKDQVRLDPTRSVSEAGLSALDRVDLRAEAHE